MGEKQEEEKSKRENRDQGSEINYQDQDQDQGRAGRLQVSKMNQASERAVFFLLMADSSETTSIYLYPLGPKTRLNSV
ncbi:hypothetical protein TRV_06822 [Trichophyton verrucosum HKI 0517]|uniref:Uncharacterized protein n=1 Tax=Trichophyton verrucosum (strain HKI 0517) TaxID=663202 RepID=D4DI15_TRIVH|nr:uncharacterized protein TRV_06822 [Trichophyton verrucosum HKI 0517]EFE38493.1 hypothetical protein TRV_06822 [Trichophyton verrucosum HKI 0517]